jgi:tetratricopeptide (TPR) repeat protein
MAPKTIVRAITFVAAAGLLLPPGFSQGRGGTTPSAPAGGGTTGTTGAGAGTPTTTSPGRTTPTSPTSPNNTNTQQQPAMTQPIFISGRVMMEDGTAPSEPATIERVCGSSTRAEGYTDSKGYFSIELGRQNGVMQDASESQVGRDFGMGGMGGMGSSGSGSGLGGNGMGGMGADMRLMNCELRARLSGYRSQVVNLANRRPMDNPDIGVILLHRMAPSEGTTVSASSLAAPKDAKKAFDKGMDALKKRKPEDAVKAFEKAVDVYPGYATAWYELGRLQMAKGDKEAALKSFDTSAKADPKYVAPLVEIAILDVQDQNWKEVAQVTDQAAKLDSFDYPQVFLFNAVANFNLRNVEAAEKSARQAEKLDTRHQYPKSSHLIGIIMAQRKDYQGAAEQFRSYLKFAPGASDAATVRTQLDQIEKLTAQGAAAVDKEEK